MNTLSGTSQATGTIFNVQRFCIEDGPGIRTTIFFKGCPLRCPWCHNPEGISAEPQIVFNESRCIACQGCIEACDVGTGENSSADCRRCGMCVDACPTGARELAGRKWTVDEVRSLVLRDQIFYDSSEGGVTFSGGEPMSQPDFLIACLKACRDEGVHTTLDTCGYGSRDRLLQTAAVTDLVLFDLKILRPEDHLRILGVPLEPILSNLDALAQRQQRIWLRLPVIPGITDTNDNLRRIQELTATMPSIEKICLLPYHASGVTKHLNLNHKYDLETLIAPSDHHMAEVAAHFSGAVPHVVIGG